MCDKVNPLFVWDGQEHNIYSSCVVVTGFVITSFEPLLDGPVFTGTISLMDYAEYCSFTDEWTARFVSEGDKPGWMAYKTPSERSSFTDAVTGESLFTASEKMNLAIKQFIISRAVSYYQNPRDSEQLPIYEGPVEPWSGICVCSRLEASIHVPFDWQAHTGGKFPENCFACSCGARWWLQCVGHNHWIRVADPAAWEIFIKYNGVPKRVIGIFDDGQVYLLDTLCTQGLIPIG